MFEVISILLRCCMLFSRYFIPFYRYNIEIWWKYLCELTNLSQVNSLTSRLIVVSDELFYFYITSLAKEIIVYMMVQFLYNRRILYVWHIKRAALYTAQILSLIFLGLRRKQFIFFSRELVNQDFRALNNSWTSRMRKLSASCKQMRPRGRNL